MRPELYEYNYDELLRRTVTSSKRALRASPKELSALFNVIPDWEEPFSMIGKMDNVGHMLFGIMQLWMDRIIHAHERGHKLVLTTFCYPVGVLGAFDCVALNMEIMTALGNILWKRGVFDFYDYCTELGMTDTSCAGQRGAIGAYLADLGETPDFILINSPGFCDSNANSFQFYGAYKDVPMYTHDCPPELTGERSLEYHRRDFRNMLKFMEEQTGKKIDWDYLREVMAEIKRQDELVDEIMTLTKLVPCPVPSYANAVLYFIKLAFSGFKEATPILEEIVRVTKRNIDLGIAGTVSGVEEARVFPCYIDHYTQGMKFWTFLNRHNITHLGSILDYFWNEGAPYDKGNPGEMYKMDPTNEDTIVDSLAGQLARMPMVKQIIGPYNQKTQWLEDTLSAAKLYQADAIVYIGTFGCRNTWSMVKPFAADLEKAGYPTYVLVADAFDDRVASWETCEKRLLEFFHLRGIIEKK